MLKIQKMNFVKSDHLSKGNNGWRLISGELQKISDRKGTICYEWLDLAISERILDGKWSGFLHNPITYPSEEYPAKYNKKVRPISELVKDDYFLGKLEDCQSIFVFTNQIKNFIVKETGFKNVFSLKHPSAFSGTKKRWIEAENLLHVGQQMRKYHSFADLKCNTKKVMILPKNCESDIKEMKIYRTGSQNDVEYVRQIKLSRYEDLMCESIVFLDLYDVAACNTILECISLSVPILINRLEGCVDYLGDKYPLFYENLQDAERKIADKKLICRANKYLNRMIKEDISIDFFIRSICRIVNQKSDTSTDLLCGIVPPKVAHLI